MSEKTAIAQLLQSPETTATVIHGILLNKYGKEAYLWDMVTMMLEVKADYAVDMHSNVINRWAAIQTIMTTDAFFRHIEAFLAICNTLSTGEPFFQVFDPVTVEEAAWGLSEVSLNRDMLPFAPAIKRYVEQQLEADGYGGDEPDIFDTVFDKQEAEQGLRSVLREIYRTPNHDVVEAYIDDQLRDIAYQFGKVPSLKTVDDILMREDDKTLVEAL